MQKIQQISPSILYSIDEQISHCGYCGYQNTQTSMAGGWTPPVPLIFQLKDFRQAGGFHP